MAIFPSAISTDADLYIAVNNLSTLLTDNPLTIGATTVNAISTAGFPTVGTISIDAEIIKYTGKTATSFTGCTRGFDGTTAASHALNAQIDHNVVAAHHNVHKDELIAVEQFISDLIGRENTHIQAPFGTAALPSYTFEGDENTGLYRVSADVVAFAIGGAQQIIVDSGGLDLTNNSGIRMPSGVAAGPVLAHRSNTDSGLYWPTTTSIAFSADTSPIVTLRGDNSVDLGIFLNRGYLKFGTAAGNGGDGTAANPILTWESDPDTGIFRSAANSMSFAAGGSNRLNVTSTDVTVVGVPLQVLDGTAAVPGVAFNNDLDTGIYRPTTNQFAISAGGAVAILCDPSAVNLYTAGTLRWQMDGNLTSAQTTSRILNSDGSAAAPSYTFGTDSDSGMYTTGSDTVRFAAGGVQKVRMDANGTYLMTQGFIANGSASVPGLSFDLDRDTGLYKDQTGSCAITSDSQVVARFYNINSVDRGIVAAFGGFISTPDGVVTLPAFRWDSDPDTGFYRIGSGDVAYSGNGVVSVRFLPTSSAVSTESTLLAHFNSLGIRQLNYGAADTGGAGFRLLRIPN